VNIGGALGVVGQKTLNHYQWGQTVVNIVNSHLKDGEYITVFHSGMEVTEVILKMDDELKSAILSIDIGPLHGSISLDEHEQSNRSLALLLISCGFVVVAFFITYTYMQLTGMELTDSEKSLLDDFLTFISDNAKSLLKVE
jgi:hypothetical protein